MGSDGTGGASAATPSDGETPNRIRHYRPLASAARQAPAGTSSALGQVLPSKPPAAMAAASGEVAETAGKRTHAALTAGLRLTAAVPGTGAGWRPIANAQKATFAAFAKLR